MSIKTMRTRLDYAGGNQLGRINQSKLKSFRMVLGNTQHTRRVKTPTGECWKALMHDDKLTADYDKKILCVENDAGLKAGDVVEVLDDGTHWLVHLPSLTETAYFHADVIRCRYTIDVDGVTYWAYLRGPDATAQQWLTKEGLHALDMNLNARLFITQDERTEEFFKRLRKLRIAGRPWEIHTSDHISAPGVIEVDMRETFDVETEDIPDVTEECPCHQIVGSTTVEQDCTVGYEIRGDFMREGGEWFVEGNDRVRIDSVTKDGRFCTVRVYDAAMDGFTIRYGDRKWSYYLNVGIKCCCKPIQGPVVAYPYDTLDYELREGTGNFFLETDKAKIVSSDGRKCRVEVTSGRSFTFKVFVKRDNGTVESTDVEVRSL